MGGQHRTVHIRNTSNRFDQKLIKFVYFVLLTRFFIIRIFVGFLLLQSILRHNTQKRIPNKSSWRFSLLCSCARPIRLFEVYVLQTQFHFYPIFMIISFVLGVLWIFDTFLLPVVYIGVNTIIVLSSLWHALLLELPYTSLHTFLRGHHSIALNNVRVHYYALVYLLSHCYSSFWCLCVHKYKWRVLKGKIKHLTELSATAHTMCTMYIFQTLHFIYSFETHTHASHKTVALLSTMYY